MISLWLFGSLLEGEFGSRWIVEYLVATTLGGGVLAALIAATGVTGARSAASRLAVCGPL